MKFIRIIGCFCIFLFTSCEKPVTFKLNETDPKLVVEGTIENNKAPIVYLSKSLDYYSSISPALIVNSFVHNAEVYISNSIITHQLKEYVLPVSGGYNFYYYSLDSSNLSTAILGELNNSYTLKISWNGKEYSASTKIPDTTVHIESIYWKQAPAGNPAEKIALMVKAYDPPGYGDYVRYFTKRNSEPFYPGLNSVYDDQVVDGSVYDLQFERGIERTGSTPEGYSFFDKGDTVTVKLCNIDKSTYDFWRTMEYTYTTIGNPFSYPTKVLSNISGGALGYFGGYAVQYRTVIIPQ